MYDRLTDDEIVCIRRAEAAWLWERLRVLRSDAGPPSTLDDDTRAELAALAIKALPDELLRNTHRLRNGRNRRDVLLVQGLLPISVGLPATPETSRSARADVVELWSIGLLAVMSLLGEPFTFASLHGGRLVQDVVPVRGEEEAQTSEGSDGFLDWHVEDAFSPDRCDYLGLLCLRDDPAAETVFTSVRSLPLRGWLAEILGERRFVVRADVAHGAGADRSGPVGVITGSAQVLETCFDAVYSSPEDPDDSEAAVALAELRHLVGTHAIAHVLRSGELLVLDNRRVVHGRTSFRPRFDGTDRWLLRAMVCSAIPRHRRRGAARVIPATTVEER